LTSALSDNYFKDSVTESQLGLEQCSCPCETEIPVFAAEQDLTGVASLIAMILLGGLLHLIRQSAIISIVSRGTIRAEINKEFIYPQDSNNRFFSNSVYCRKTANGESYLRT
jgi:hypothetical protein